MDCKGFRELERISHVVGNKAEYVQGGGGNTSVKLEQRQGLEQNLNLETKVEFNKLMAVKASGYKLKQITTEDGFVVVNYKNIKEYYEKVDFEQDIDYEKDSVKFTKDNIVKIEGLKELRPSVEAGFHSILKKYVIHTHPVYANIVCCSTNGEELVREIFPEEQWNTLWIPYVNPGFFLTVKIKDGIEKCEKKGKFPEVIFMENHGLIVTSDDMENCITLHNKVNDQIKKYFKIDKPYPEIKIIRLDKEISKNYNISGGYHITESEDVCGNRDAYISMTGYLKDFFKGSNLCRNFFEKYVLYPDQLVYLNDSASLDKDENRLNINTLTGELIYRTNYNEALTIEETLLAYIYIIKNIEKCGLKVKSMTLEEIDYIRNWESEKYRKSLMK
ncbi:MAG TPA: class II aldolase/adducin family protein [Clostridiales bacterium]|mgnify:CR=1 FL=1|nr:class II aldolase/adducin family protein [Clostridiales bacterium]